MRRQGASAPWLTVVGVDVGTLEGRLRVTLANRTFTMTLLSAVAAIALVLAPVWLTRVLAAALVGVTPLDPGAFTGAVGVLLVVSLVAMLVPAWRATQVDPAITLQAE